jgi:hypothetical protein
MTYTDEATEATEILFYPTKTVLVFADGHSEVIERSGIEYTQEPEEMN